MDIVKYPTEAETAAAVRAMDRRFSPETSAIIRDLALRLMDAVRAADERVQLHDVLESITINSKGPRNFELRLVPRPQAVNVSPDEPLEELTHEREIRAITLGNGGC